MTSEKSSFADRHASLEAVRAKARELRLTSSALRQRTLATRQDLFEALNEARAIRSIVGDHLASLRPAAVVEAAADASGDLPAALAIDSLDTDALDEMAAELIVAYQDAVADDDGEMVRLLGHALKSIGRYLARQIGPKAAGVILN